MFMQVEMDALIIGKRKTFTGELQILPGRIAISPWAVLNLPREKSAFA